MREASNKGSLKTWRWWLYERRAPLPSAQVVNLGTSNTCNLRKRSPPNPISNSPFHTRGSSTRSSSFDGIFSNDRSYHPSPRSSLSLLDELRSERVQKNKDSPSKPHQELNDLYQSPYLRDALIASPSFQSRVLFLKQQTRYISRLKNLRKEHEKASKLKEEGAESLKVLRSLKKEAEDDLFDLVIVGSPLPTRMPSTSAGPTTYETVTQGSSIEPRTKHEELMRYIPQPLQRLMEKIDNPPQDGDCGYTCAAWSSGQGRSTPELIRKHLSAELKKDKKMYEMIEGRNIDEDIRNTQAGKSAGVAGCLKMPLFWYAIANHLRRPLHYFYLDSMHTYVPTNCSYSSYPPFCMAFVDTNLNGSIPALPIDVWWFIEYSSRNKNLWLQSLKNV
ncbi:hypothetical protein BY996DRAFT_6507675 [Phakopsora pachyrhizi]|nr:hypothetical protein BY996DRAFT_6507675 [Phakopsora pachyrhizi]